MRIFEKVLVWLLVASQVGWAIPVDAGAPQALPAPPVTAAPAGPISPASAPPPTIRPNRRVPAVKPVPRTPVFSAWPTEQEIFGARVLEEPLVPVNGSPSPEETRALARSLQAYLANGSGENVGPLVAFLEGHAVSVWRASLQLNLGLVYLRTGYYSRAVGLLDESWAVAKRSTESHGRAVADRALGELIRLDARLGKPQRVEELLQAAEQRNVGGSAAEMIEQGKQILWFMRQHPERSLRCGPVGIGRILALAKPGRGADPIVDSFAASARGTSLRQMRDLSAAVGLDLQMARRDDRRAEMPAPALIHWGVGHFAALLKAEERGVLIEDPAFGPARWRSHQVVADEASGYALVPAGPLPRGWRPVDEKEAESVWGMGPTCENDPECQTGGCGGGGAGGGGGGGGDHQSGGSAGGGGCSGGYCPRGGAGMADYSFHTMLVSLHVFDTPVGYTPSRGPAVQFGVNYHQREVFQPQIFTYSNLGPKWTSLWISYIEDDPTSPGQPATVYLRAGGRETYTTYDPATHTYDYHPKSRAQVVKVSDDPVVYERRLPDGGLDVYAQPNGALAFPRKVFLTRSIDPQGNAVELTYDSSLRLVAITDAIGQVTILSHDLPGDSYKITRVTDPFGRYATFEYDSLGRLSRITDVVGIQSSFEYGSGDFIKSLTTPYGTTAFRTAEAGRQRWLEATDPLGETERLEYVNSIRELAPPATITLPDALPPSQVPTGFYWAGSETGSSYYWYRNTFYWSKRAHAEAPGDYTAAKLMHWKRSADLTQTAGVIENEKEPLETVRTFYKYPNQTPTGVGSHATPSAVGRVMEDGASQIWQYEYNARGKTTKATDPLGRESVYVYGTNNVPDANPTTGDGIDLLQIKQKNGGSYDLIWSATFNAQHLPLAVTDAAGRTTTYTYNSAGQVLTITTPERVGVSENRTTTYVYDTNGYLQTVAGPAAGATTGYTYDGYGRVRTITNSDNYTLTYDYDALDRTTRVTYPDGTYDETVYKWLDAEKRRDRLGRWTQSFYDPLRRLVARKEPTGAVTQYQYGGSGCTSCAGGGDRLTKLIDPNGNAIAWEYDLQGRLIREVRADASDTVVTYETTSSRVKQIRDRKQQVIDLQYFLDNNWKQVSYSDTPQPTPTVSFTYDPVYNRLGTMTDGTGTTSYTYYPVTSPATLGAGRLQTADGPLGSDAINYTYDELGRVVGRSINGVARSLAYDSLGRLSGETNALGSFTYGYDGVTERVTTIGYPNGQNTTYSYLPNSGDHRLQQVLNQRTGGATLSSFQHAYDANGMLTSWTQQADSNPSRVYALERDPVERLLAATLQTADPTPTVLKRYRYGYDGVGNRTTEQADDSAVAATYDSLNALTALRAGGALSFRGSVSEPATVIVQGKPAAVDAANAFQGQAQASSGTTDVVVAATDASGNTRTNTYQVSVGGSASTFTYDGNGNLTSDGVRTFEWDGANRLTAVNQGTHRSEFTYDGWGLRVRMVERDNGAVTGDRRFVWCGTTVCEERDGSGLTITRRFFTQGVEEGGTPLFYTTDHLGNIRELTDATGALRARYEYDPYGRPTKLSGDKDSVFTFAGLVNHAPSGLLLANYRAYDPSLGRWISQDPIGLAGGLNVYGYVGGGPVDRTDPLGLLVGPAPIIIGGLTTGGILIGGPLIAIGILIALQPPGGVPPNAEPHPQPAPPPPPPNPTTNPTTTTTTPQPVPSPVPPMPPGEPECDEDDTKEFCRLVPEKSFPQQCMYRCDDGTVFIVFNLSPNAPPCSPFAARP